VRHAGRARSGNQYVNLEIRKVRGELRETLGPFLGPDTRSSRFDPESNPDRVAPGEKPRRKSES
jgi:hypothetical protein